MSNVYEHTLTLAELSRALGVARTRAEQWVNRGLIDPKLPGGQGKTRRWTFLDAMRLAILIDVADAQLPLSGIGDSEKWHGEIENWLNEVDRHTKWIHGFTDDSAFLIIRYGLHEMIQSTPRGSPPSKMGGGIKVLQPGLLDSDVVRWSKLANHLASPDGRLFVVIPLSQIEQRIRTIWEASLKAAASNTKDDD